MKLLAVLLSLAFSQVVFAAEKCTNTEGEELICFKPDKAKELLAVVQEEKPSLERQIELLKKELKLQKELTEHTEEQLKVEREENVQWKRNYEDALRDVEDKRRKVDFRKDIGIYTHLGMFVLGAAIGGVVMYCSSLLLSNTLQKGN